MRVLISGAGVAGPTLAFFLAKAGVRCTVLEKSKSLQPHGQNVDLQGSAVTVVKSMGLLDEVRRRNTNEKGTQFIDSDGKPFAPFPMSEGCAASLTSQFEILRGDLAALLYDATRNHPNIEYVFGTTITNVISNGEKSVKVELSDGQVQKYDILVAADGQWSRVRKQCFAQEDVNSVYKGMYAVYYTVPRISSDNDLWNIYVTSNSRLITLRPDLHGTTRAMFSLMPVDKVQEKEWLEAGRSSRQTQQKLVWKEFATAGWQAERLLNAMNDAPDFYFHVIQQIKMKAWSTSRVVCLGDAAYAPSPLTGMGTSLAIVGAYVLAGEISKLEANEHPSKAFKAYENDFKPFVEKMQQVPSFVPGIGHPNSAWKRWMLQMFLRVISRIVALPWVQKRLPDPGNTEDFLLPEYPKLMGEKFV